MTWQQDNRGPDKLSRWIRCLFSLALSEAGIAVQLLDQAMTVAEEARKVCNSTSSRRSSNTLAHYLPRPCSSPNCTHRKNSNGLQQRPSIAQLTFIVFRKMRRAGSGLRRHWRCRISVRMEELYMRYFSRNTKACLGIHDGVRKALAPTKR